jgi:trehalose/maltose transport system substrate-binding protein
MLKMTQWFLMIALVTISPVIAESVHLRMTCQTDGKEAQLCKAGAERWAKKNGHTVEVIAIPHNQNDFAYLIQMMSSQSPDIDVYVIDVVWVGSFAEHLVDLSTAITDEEKMRFFPAMLKNNIINNRLVALPWYTDAGLLYYRKDLLEKYNRQVPTTWEELGETARIIQAGERKEGNDKMWGFVFQARAQECLTCNAYEWLVSHNAGTLIDEHGKLALDKDNAVKALTLIQGFIGTITPQGVLNYAEEEARGIFQTGNAVFMRNWPYAWALAHSPDSPIKGKIGITALPKGQASDRSVATLGGWQLAVSKYGKNPTVAIDLIRYLSSPEEQKIRAIEGSINPTIQALYSDSDILQAHPFFADLLPTINNAVARPATIMGANYQELSNEIATRIHKTISNKDYDVGKAVDELKAQLLRLSAQAV